jgi:hypothetical protein
MKDGKMIDRTGCWEFMGRDCICMNREVTPICFWPLLHIGAEVS